MFKSSTQPLCRCCGGPIPKHLRTVYVVAADKGYRRTDDARWLIAGDVKTLDACEALTHHTVVDVRWTNPGPAAKRAGATPSVYSFTEWDGESYVGPFFCGQEHALKFADVMAKAGHQTKASADARRALKVSQ